ncbi:MAG: nucleotide exchange factor GrpE [Thermodesulfobacteria bacterium]|nr:nucleotide exchange factor GrpE [Thermodesulfobacteriota bacterium]
MQEAKEEVREEVKEEVKDKVEEEKKEEVSVKAEADKESQEQKIDEELKYWKNMALRYAAEVENLKKSFKREKEEYYKFALESVFKELLPAIDNLERALEAFSQSQNIEALKQGVELTLKSIIQALEKFGLTQFEPAIGEPFHPNFHEALSTEEHPEVPSGAITKVYQKGYKLHERVIRPALVCVSSGKSQEKSETQQKSEN